MKIKQRAVKQLIRTKNGSQIVGLWRIRPFFYEIGYFRSWELGTPVDKSDQYLPWYTYSAISFLLKRLNSGMRVFEYGSGYSTLWWADHVAYVTSIEHDTDWFKLVQSKIPPNVDLIFCPLEYGGEYSQIIQNYVNEFHIIVIDGRDRVRSAINSINALRDDGVIVWDNSERESYAQGLDHLKHNGFKRIDFDGLGPLGRFPWSTSLLYRSNNCLDI